VTPERIKGVGGGPGAIQVLLVVAELLISDAAKRSIQVRQKHKLLAAVPDEFLLLKEAGLHLMEAVCLGHLGGGGVGGMDGVESRVDGGHIGNAARLRLIRGRRHGEREETKGTISAIGVNGDGIGIDGFVELMELQPAG
jgi:hypothetical protein